MEALSCVWLYLYFGFIFRWASFILPPPPTDILCCGGNIGQDDGDLDAVVDVDDKGCCLYNARQQPLLIGCSCLTLVKHGRHHLCDLLPDFNGIQPPSALHHGVDELMELVLVHLLEPDPVRVAEDGVSDVGARPVDDILGYPLLGPNTH